MKYSLSNEYLIAVIGVIDNNENVPFKVSLRFSSRQTCLYLILTFSFWLLLLLER